MKRLKEIILSLCLILIGVSVILTVSAVDNNIIFNEINNTTENTTNDDVVSNTTNDVVVSNATTFKELQEDINKYDNIELAHDIDRAGGKTIEINKPITINGKEHMIDGENNRIFNIKSNGNLTLKNSKIINGKAGSVEGGAIYNNQGTLTIQDSTFKDNKAWSYGGGIYNNKGTLTIQGSTFNNNKDERDEGGAIYNNQGTLTIQGSTFNNNEAEKGFGGAIYNNEGTLTIQGSTFNNNKAEHEGGAINNKYGTLTITDSEFTNNKGVDTGKGSSYGGAINNDHGTLTIQGSTFNNNEAEYDGGAICSNNGKVNPIKNCTFNHNIANGAPGGRCEGGAIKCTGNNNPLIVTDCQFTGNRAEDGGAIDCRVLQISNCVFTENKASNAALACNGGAVNCNDLNECHDCNFTGNTADNGGAIAIMEKAGKNMIKDCIFKDNKAIALKGGVNGKGGAIFVNRLDAHISIIHNQFIDNYAKNKADNVYNWGSYDKIGHNYFPNKKQNGFRDQNKVSHSILRDDDAFYNLEDYYKWKE